MKARVSAAVVLIVLVGIGLYVAGSGSSSGQEQAKAQARTKWEYKVVTAGGGGTLGVIDEKILSKLGDDGWELHTISDGQPYVASSASRYTFGKPDNTSTTNTMNYTRTVYYFKRPK